MDFRDLTAPATTGAMSLDAVLARLAASPDVEGIVTVGSTAGGPLTSTSDYDVFVAVASDPPPLDLALTVVDGRVAEFYVFALAFVERAAAETAATTGDTWAGSIAPRLATGNLVFDRGGRLAAARETIRAALPLAPYAPGAAYATWFKINYDAMQTRRMARSPDPVYQTAVEYRATYTISELWTGYCTVRGLSWRGEKEFVRYCLAHDSDYLDLSRRCMGEPDRERKLALYLALAGRTLAPVGGLWGDDATAVQGPKTPDDVPDALAYWQGLLAGDGAR